MNRFFTTLVVFAILLVAVGLGIRQTLETGEAGPMLVLQGIAGFGLLAGSGLLIRQRYLYRTSAKREGFVLGEPIRRLLSSVWS